MNISILTLMLDWIKKYRNDRRKFILYNSQLTHISKSNKDKTNKGKSLFACSCTAWEKTRQKKKYIKQDIRQHITQQYTAAKRKVRQKHQHYCYYYDDGMLYMLHVDKILRKNLMLNFILKMANERKKNMKSERNKNKRCLWMWNKELESHCIWMFLCSLICVVS